MRQRERANIFTYKCVAIRQDVDTSSLRAAGPSSSNAMWPTAYRVTCHTTVAAAACLPKFIRQGSPYVCVCIVDRFPF